MPDEALSFGDYVLEPHERRLLRNGEPVDLGARYLDVLLLLLRHRGELVTKNRFLDEAWKGVPVTDEALTQAIRSLRQALGDEAQNPRFIETVPRYGYRFIAPVENVREPTETLGHRAVTMRVDTPSPVLMAALGGALAGAMMAVFYTFAASAPSGSGASAGVSLLVVMVAICAGIAAVAAMGIALGIEIADRFAALRQYGPIVGGAIGGFVTGGLGNLVGTDAFGLLVGRAPLGVSGALEGLCFGAAIGLLLFLSHTGTLAGERKSWIALAAMIGAASGALVPLLGGTMLGGSLVGLSNAFPEAAVRLDTLGSGIGDPGFGPLTAAATGALEGMLFCLYVAGALAMAQGRARHLTKTAIRRA